MEHGAWSMEHGAWSMEQGAWSMEHGAWGMEVDSNKKAPGSPGGYFIQVCSA